MLYRIVVHKWVWIDDGLYFTLVSLLFSAIFISIFNILNIIFTLVSVVFLNPFMDFDLVFKLLEYTDGGTR